MKPPIIAILSRPCVPDNTICVYRLKYGSRYFYVGAAKCLNKRVSGHIVTLKRGLINGFKLPSFTGRDTIYFEILEIVDDINNLSEREQYYLDLHKNKSGSLNTTRESSSLYKLRKKNNRIKK
jgi:hypothetical protein